MSKQSGSKQSSDQIVFSLLSSGDGTIDERRKMIQKRYANQHLLKKNNLELPHIPDKEKKLSRNLNLKIHQDFCEQTIQKRENHYENQNPNQYQNPNETRLNRQPIQPQPIAEQQSYQLKKKRLESEIRKNYEEYTNTQITLKQAEKNYEKRRKAVCEQEQKLHPNQQLLRKLQKKEEKAFEIYKINRDRLIVINDQSKLINDQLKALEKQKKQKEKHLPRIVYELSDGLKVFRSQQ